VTPGLLRGRPAGYATDWVIGALAASLARRFPYTEVEEEDEEGEVTWVSAATGMPDPFAGPSRPIAAELLWRCAGPSGPSTLLFSIAILQYTLWAYAACRSSLPYCHIAISPYRH
jgi:hypothetical protein